MCRACSGKKQVGNGITSQDQLLSQSTDDQEESTWVRNIEFIDKMVLSV